jgi:large subunit ribosomal protein L6
MSRLGKLPINIPDGVEVKLDKRSITVKGPKGELKREIMDSVKVEMEDKVLKVSVARPEVKKEKAYWGLYRSLINNMVVGVSTGFQRKLEIIGVGYRAAVAGQKITFNLGYSHQIEFILPQGISAVLEANVLTLSGFDNHLLGNTAAKIRNLRKPEPYKGKGIKYAEEVILRKEGKTASK